MTRFITIDFYNVRLNLKLNSIESKISLIIENVINQIGSNLKCSTKTHL